MRTITGLQLAGEILVRQLAARIGKRALGQSQAHAHLRNADRDRGGVVDGHSGYLFQIRGINYFGNQGGAKRDHALCAGFVNKATNQAGGLLSDFQLALVEVCAVNTEAPDTSDESFHAHSAQERQVYGT